MSRSKNTSIKWRDKKYAEDNGKRPKNDFFDPWYLWVHQNPGWWTNMQMTRPARTKERAVKANLEKAQTIEDLEEIDELPLHSRKPHIYYT